MSPEDAPVNSNKNRDGTIRHAEFLSFVPLQTLLRVEGGHR